MNQQVKYLQADLAASGGRATGPLGQLRAQLSAHYALTLFVAVFLVPTVIAAIYFGLIASDRYISETRFIVRSASKSANTGAAAYLQDIGITRANDDAFAVQDYIESRDVMHAIMQKIDLRKVWQRPGADFLSRYDGFGVGDTDESLYRYYQQKVTVDKNTETGITTVKVSAYRGTDAAALTQLILELSEQQVNGMNVRARNDRLALSGQELDKAARRLAEATVGINQYRNSAGLVDPALTAQASTEQSSSLDGQLAQSQAELQTMQSRSPDNPTIPAYRQRIGALTVQVAAEHARMTGSQGSLGNKVGGYERLMVERELAQKIYESAQRDFDDARDKADAQEIFIETIARPNLPDSAIEPQRLRYAATAALLAFWSFLIFYLLVSGSREHLNLH